jgi:hypothetical protein
LIFFDELKQFDIVILELLLRVLQSLRFPLALDVKLLNAVLNDVLRQLYKEHLFLLLNEVIDVLLVFT